MNIYKQKNITCFLFFIIVSLQTVAQEAVNLKSIKKEIGKPDKLLATEFAATKLIPAEILIMRQFECRDSLGFYSPEKISTDSFYISAYEVTNMQYRQFLEYVQDSIVRKLIGYVKEDKDGNECLDLSKKIDIKKIRKHIEFTGHGPFTPMFTDTNGIILFKPRYLVYTYRSGEKRIQISVMPGMEGLMGVHPYSYKEPGFNNYLYHHAFDNYPVTGVIFLQAKAYCHWKTQQLKNALGNSSKFDIIFSLPTKPQWEAAAVSGLLPDNNSTLNNRQCLLENENQGNTNTKNGINEAIGFRYVVSFKRKAE